MKITSHAEIDTTPEAVFAVISDPEFAAAKAAAMSVGEHAGTVTTKGQETVVTTTRTLPTEELPDVARKFVGPVLEIVEEQTWGPADTAGNRQARLRLHVSGVPVTFTGTITLRADGVRTRQDVVGDLVAKIPFVGGTIEKAAAPAIEGGISYDVDLIKQRLAEG